MLNKIRDNSGSVLVLSLWILTLLSLTALSLALKARFELKLTKYQWDDICLLQSAKAGVVHAVSVLSKHRAIGYSALNQEWAHAPALFEKLSMAKAKLTFARDTQDAMGERKRFYGLADEESKINLNHAPKEVLEKIFSMEPDIVPCLMDWRDKNNAVLSSGAESRYYESLPNPYSCRNGPLRSLAELSLVKGVTPDIFDEVKEVLTVFGTGQVNLNTASPAVLEKTGLTGSLAEKIRMFREGEDFVMGTEDDGVFESLGSVLQRLNHLYALTDEERVSLNHCLQKKMLCVKSTCFRLNMMVRTFDSRSWRRYDIVVSPYQKGLQPLYWSEVL